MNREPPSTLSQLLREAWTTSAGTALRVLLACGVVAVVVNAWFHPAPIPFVADRRYEVLVPCPEPGGPVAAMDAADPRLTAPATFLVDARPREQYQRWHVPGAVNLPYSYLDATPADTLAAMARAIAAAAARQVVVYGDGDDPDSGELLGREISGDGIRRVYFVPGGALVLQPPDVVGVPPGIGAVR